ncbi:MBL fold metallo-hydrolase [Duganella qianjiadongensis]|uniref:MBL fold metallo-hydrolase n=1 Tax=Duganella qianjiadongensis TaxID=2692176 RepID=A0ABW9VKW4_9BURK|nr:MBL fold metallo-hydrolase [Duganella qianjiadongensis]MYM40091.1 MBL fold metallo-hydrolase [Duganella qianjiadongensis]
MTLKISRILHAGYVFECAGRRIVFDPIFENPFSHNCHAFPSVRFDLAQIRTLAVDAVFISHFHDDHCSFDSLDLLDRATPIYLYCHFEELFELIRQLGFSDVHALAVDQPVQLGPFEVIPRRALDADVDSMFHVRAAGLNVLNVVDAWMDPETLQQLAPYAPWDMVLWPFQTMREVDVIAPDRASRMSADVSPLPEEWPQQLQALAPRYVVPSSCQFVQEPWSWYNHAMFPVTYRQFAAALADWLPQTQVVRMNPSVGFELSAQGLAAVAPLPWVIPVGEQDVDFDYRPELAPPPTAQIARHFAALTPEQSALALDFCRAGLLDKYRAMELPEDSYFAAACGWQLSVYDHAGRAQQFRYRIHGDEIELDDSIVTPPWQTEIPLAKLYAGLALGESLTSMYVRINGAPPEADVVDDPLIRCLFNDAFAAYQAAQLRRILAARIAPAV